MKRSRREVNRKRKWPSPASSEDEIHPDATLGPDTATGLTTAVLSGNTTTSETGDEERDPESYVETGAALIDKHVFGRRPLRRVMAVIAVGAIVFIFIDDNRSRSIELFCWGQLLWSLAKGVALAATIAAVYGLYSLVDRSVPKAN